MPYPTRAHGIIVNFLPSATTLPLLRTFARKFSNIDFLLKILPLKDDELVMSEMRLRFGENMPGRIPKSEKIGLR